MMLKAQAFWERSRTEQWNIIDAEAKRAASVFMVSVLKEDFTE